MANERRRTARTTNTRRSGGPGRQPALPPPPACRPAGLPARTPKQMLQEADVRFRKEHRRLRDQRRRLAGDLLQYRYNIGLAAARIVDDAHKVTHERYYGSRTVADMARALDEHIRTVYQCIKFVTAVTPARLEELKAHEWPWRAVSTVITVENDHARKELTESFDSGEFGTTAEFRDAVRQTNAEIRKKKGTTDKRARGSGGAQALSMIGSFNTVMSEAVRTVLPQAIEAVELYVRDKEVMVPATRERLEAGIRESKSHIRATERMLIQAEKVVSDFEAMFPQFVTDDGAQDEGQGEAAHQG